MVPGVSCKANTTRGAADTPRGAADMPRGAADTPCGAAETLQGAANTATFTALTSFLAKFENFSKCFQLFKGQKNIFFQKVLKKWSTIQKNRKHFYHFLQGVRLATFHLINVIILPVIFNH